MHKIQAPTPEVNFQNENKRKNTTIHLKLPFVKDTLHKNIFTAPFHSYNLPLTFHSTCPFPYNIDSSKENVTQTSSINNDKTRITISEDPPLSSDFIILGETTMYYFNTIK